MPYPGYLRYFDSVVRGLAERGNVVELWFETLHKQPEGLEAIEGVPGVSVGGAIPKRTDLFARAARNARWTADFVRYLDPRFSDAVYLRERLARKLEGPVSLLGKLKTLPQPFVEAMVTLGLALERAMPRSATFDELIARSNPDVVVVSPLLTPASRLTDLVASARAAGVPSVALIASWDNFTTKGLFRILPDRVVVWNEAQVGEGVDLHRIPRERLAVTGAYPFDRWFVRKPTRDASGFRARVGLDSSEPYVLFVGSTASISHPDAEIDFVQEWLSQLRSSDNPRVRELGILVRPHPYNSAHWPQVDLSAHRGVAIFPRAGANPVNEDDRNDYFDSIHHAVAVVGINTSAMIEAAIQRKPVLSVALPAFSDTQLGTLHFRHLLPENGGFVRVARSLDEHLQQLEGVLDDVDSAVREVDRFVGSFLRPNGVELPCTPIAIDVIEGTASEEAAPAPSQGPASRLVLRAILLATGAGDPRGALPRWRQDLIDASRTRRWLGVSLWAASKPVRLARRARALVRRRASRSPAG